MIFSQREGAVRFIKRNNSFVVTCEDDSSSSGAEEFPLHRAVRRGDVNTVESLLKHGADPNEKDHRETTPIHYVNHLNEDSYQMVHVLLKYGADMLIRNCYGQLPFKEALALSNKKTCKAFVDWGFSLQKCDRMRNGTYECWSAVFRMIVGSTLL